jgi:hypothetical protein
LPYQVLEYVTADMLCVTQGGTGWWGSERQLCG